MILMAIFRVKEIRKMSKEERKTKLNELRVELSKLMTTKAMGGSLENPSRIKLLRKTIARFITIEHEESLGIGKAKPVQKGESA